MRSITRLDGVNVISGYVAKPKTATVRNLARCLHPGELREIYNHAGWEVLDYQEDYQPNQYVGPHRTEGIFSLAHIIARNAASLSDAGKGCRRLESISQEERGYR